MNDRITIARRRSTGRLAVMNLIIGMMAMLMSGCARTNTGTRPANLLVRLGKTQRGTSVRDRRAAMVANIRADVRDADQTADTPAFETALAVIGSLPREKFVKPAGRNQAYVDLPQSIGYNQTISDPYVVSIMTGALDLSPGATVLDVGTGSGYQAAVLARIARRVYSVEIVKPLARSAKARLSRLGFSNVVVQIGDGFVGWPEHAPFDGIVVAASAAAVPKPLFDQLKPGGHLVMPIGPTEMSTQLLLFTKRLDGTIDRCSLGAALFVPFTGGRVNPFNRFGLFDRSIALCFKSPIVTIF